MSRPKKENRRLPTPGGAAMVDVLANAVAIALVLIVCTIVAQLADFKDRKTQEDEFSIVLARRLATVLTFQEFPVSGSYLLHNYEECDQRRAAGEAMPTIELYESTIVIRDLAMTLTREQLLEERNSLDDYLLSLPKNARIRTDIHSIRLYYITASILIENGLGPPPHLHFIATDAPSPQGEVFEDYRDLKAATPERELSIFEKLFNINSPSKYPEHWRAHQRLPAGAYLRIASKVPSPARMASGNGSADREDGDDAGSENRGDGDYGDDSGQRRVSQNNEKVGSRRGEGYGQRGDGDAGHQGGGQERSRGKEVLERDRGRPDGSSEGKNEKSEGDLFRPDGDESEINQDRPDGSGGGGDYVSEGDPSIEVDGGDGEENNEIIATPDRGRKSSADVSTGGEPSTSGEPGIVTVRDGSEIEEPQSGSREDDTTKSSREDEKRELAGNAAIADSDMRGNSGTPDTTLIELGDEDANDREVVTEEASADEKKNAVASQGRSRTSRPAIATRKRPTREAYQSPDTDPGNMDDAVTISLSPSSSERSNMHAYLSGMFLGSSCAVPVQDNAQQGAVTAEALVMGAALKQGLVRLTPESESDQEEAFELDQNISMPERKHEPAPLRELNKLRHYADILRSFYSSEGASLQNLTNLGGPLKIGHHPATKERNGVLVFRPGLALRAVGVYSTDTDRAWIQEDGGNISVQLRPTPFPSNGLWVNLLSGSIVIPLGNAESEGLFGWQKVLISSPDAQWTFRGYLLMRLEGNHAIVPLEHNEAVVNGRTFVSSLPTRGSRHRWSYLFATMAVLSCLLVTMFLAK